MGLSTLRFRLLPALIPLVCLVVGLVLTSRYGVVGLTLAVPGGFLLLRVLTASRPADVPAQAQQVVPARAG